MTSADPLVAITPNLALDRTVRLDRPLRRGALHRVRSLRELAGGKGVNLARAVRALGGEVVVAGFLAGWNGAKLRELLQHERIAGVFEEVPGETRECHAILDDGAHPTELNEAGPDVPQQAWRRLIERLPAGTTVLSGSLPPGIDDDTFGQLLAALPEPPVVDMSGSALATAVSAGAAMITPNRAELAALLGRDSASIDDAVAYHDAHGVPLLLSLGAEGAAYLADERWRVRAPEVPSTNPVGSGDCLLGAFLWARARGHDVADALRWGVAAGADNARHGGGGNVEAGGIRALYDTIRAEEAS